jgi:hypothetical protein
MKEWLNEIATSHRTLLAMTEQEKIQIPLTPFSKGGSFFWVSRYQSSSILNFFIDSRFTAHGSLFFGMRLPRRLTKEQLTSSQ